MTIPPAEAHSTGCLQQVREGLSAAASARIQRLGHLRLTTSTNDRLLSLPPEALHGTALFADAQTQGRGRPGKAWSSPPQGGIHLSVGWCFPGLSAAALGPLSLRLGLAVLEALLPWYPAQIRLKWPNDLVAGEAKLGGLLVETRPSAQALAVVVGVGLNVQRAPTAEDLGGEGATCLAALSTAAPPPQERLMAALLEALTEALVQWPEPAADGDWLARWRARDALADVPVEWSEAGERHQGIARGPAPDGSLRVVTAAGERQIRAGAVQRVRPLVAATVA
jgi:BirA family transcriptional regulator, biotin operon repressor / biotin---[acetyl-CoA-carboxylase] ligase